jgi:hypothetical protein
MTPLQFADRYLSPPVRARYIKNLSRNTPVGIWRITNRNCKTESLNGFIEHGFPWKYTPEGFSYWQKIKRTFGNLSNREHV